MSEKNIKIEIPGNNLINCFGIQPSFVKNEISEDISLFSISRYKKWTDTSDSNIFYIPKIYKDKQAQFAYAKAKHVNDIELWVLRILLNESLHVQRFETKTDLESDKKKLRDLLLYYSELLKYKNRLNKGNFFITSNQPIFNNINFAFKQLQNWNKYIINKDYLADNLIIIGARGTTSFDNPIIASPFIDRVDYEIFKRNNKLSDFIIPDMSKRFPIISKMNKMYDNYQLYLNEKMPLRWHFEKLGNPSLYYITLHLK